MRKGERGVGDELAWEESRRGTGRIERWIT